MLNDKQVIRLQRTRARQGRGIGYLMSPVTLQGPCVWPLFALWPGSNLDFASLGLMSAHRVGVRSIPSRQEGRTEDRLSEAWLAIGCVVHSRHSDPTQVALTPVNGAERAS